MADSQKYEAVIGLEVHVQLATKSKMFCRCDNRSEDAKPNANVCPVCLGMPGTLPVPNRQAVEWALKASLALGCKISEESKFDRKQYFYPDLPKGYQISQYDQPFGGPGTFEFDVVGADGSVESKSVGITRLHLEEDAGKLTHPAGADYSLVDLNRAGTPLAEIVTEPDLRSSAEAKAFMQELRLLMRTIGVSDADMEKGHLRADANISVRPVGQQELGAKAELKNLNSFRFVEKGLEAEYARQVELLEKGETIDQETRGFDEKAGKTVSQRGKEEAHDYQYFPEPDIPPLKPHELSLDKLQAELPELPVARKRRWRKGYMQQLNATQGDESIISILAENEAEANAVDEAIKEAPEVPATVMSLWQNYKLEFFENDFNEKNYQPLIEFFGFISPLVFKKDLHGPGMKLLARKTKETKKSPKEVYESDSAFKVMDSSDLQSAVTQAIKDNPQPAADFRKGNENAAQAIVGSVMKATKGGADPRKVSQLIREKLSKS